MALKAADFVKVDDDTGAFHANMSNKTIALKIDPIPLPYSKNIQSSLKLILMVAVQIEQ